MLTATAKEHDEWELAKDRLNVKLYKAEQVIRVCYQHAVHTEAFVHEAAQMFPMHDHCCCIIILSHQK